MRVQLSAGNHADLRDEPNGGDRRAARGAISITINGDESRVFTAELEDRIMYALLKRMIIGWTLAQPLPGQAVDGDAILNNLSMDDQDALYQAVRPVYDRVLNGPKPQTISGSVLPTTSSGDPAPPARSLTSTSSGPGSPSDTGGLPSK